METLPGKREIDKKESRGEIFPFCPKPMGRSRVELSLAPPRAAERQDFFGKFQGRGFNSGDLRKLRPDRELDPCPRATGPKVLPIRLENRRF